MILDYTRYKIRKTPHKNNLNHRAPIMTAAGAQRSMRPRTMMTGSNVLTSRWQVMVTDLTPVELRTPVVGAYCGKLSLLPSQDIFGTVFVLFFFLCKISLNLTNFSQSEDFQCSQLKLIHIVSDLYQ